MSTKALAHVLVALVLLGAIVYAKRPPSPQPDPELGSIGVRIKTRSPTKLGRAYAHAVYFVRLGAHEDGLAGEHILQSNYTLNRPGSSGGRIG
jgi:hypothetical protein